MLGMLYELLKGCYKEIWGEGGINVPSVIQAFERVLQRD